MSDTGTHKAIRQKRTQRKNDPNGGSLIRVDASCGAADKVVCTAVTVHGSARLHADELDAEAAYYRRRAIQEQQALGPGYYVDLLWAIATDRAAMAQRIRTGQAATQPAPRKAGQTMP